MACNYDAEATDDDGSCDYCSCSDGSVSSSDYSTVEVYGEDLLAGHTTYCFYMNVANEDDFLSSIYGNDLDAFGLTTSTGSTTASLEARWPAASTPRSSRSSLTSPPTAGSPLASTARTLATK